MTKEQIANKICEKDGTNVSWVIIAVIPWENAERSLLCKKDKIVEKFGSIFDDEFKRFDIENTDFEVMIQEKLSYSKILEWLEKYENLPFFKGWLGCKNDIAKPLFPDLFAKHTSKNNTI